ncbi:MAG: mshN [Proteobacteria bacterium]|nr:mshN [Pseudomonadota bacterium]
MSLINQMLRDLDARGVDKRLPNDVRPLPAPRRSRLPVIFGSLAVLLLAVGLAVHQLNLMQPLVASSPAPATAITPAVGAAPVALPPAPPQALATTAPLAETPTPVPPAPPPGLVPPLPATTVPEASPRSRPAPPKAAPAEKKSVEKPVKAAAVDGEPTASRKPQATPSPAAADRAPPAVGKSAKESTIERSDSAGSPRARAESEYRKAIDAVNQGRVAEAVDGLTRALRDDPLHTGARQLLVKLLLEARRVDEALQALHEGLQGQPAQLGWAMTLARLQVDRGDLAGAWQTLEFSLPAAERNADYQGFAAHVLQRLGRQREAAVYYQAATRLVPGDGRWWLGLGLAMEAEGRVSESREALLRAKQCGNLNSALSALVEQKLR